MLLKIGYKFRKVFNQANNYLFNSITSRSEKFPLSMLKRTKVRTVWNPYIPAAPDLCAVIRVSGHISPSEYVNDRL